MSPSDPEQEMLLAKLIADNEKLKERLKLKSIKVYNLRRAIKQLQRSHEYYRLSWKAAVNSSHAIRDAWQKERREREREKPRSRMDAIRQGVRDTLFGLVAIVMAVSLIVALCVSVIWLEVKLIGALTP